MSFEEADRLIERYYDGFTTVEEENRLHVFLSQPDLPAKYLPEKDILHFLHAQKERPTFVLAPYVRWLSGAAAAVVLLIGLNLHFKSSAMNFAYVDGHKVTNVQKVKSVAMASLKGLSNAEVRQNLDDVSGQKIIQQQLGVFSGLGK